MICLLDFFVCFNLGVTVLIVSWPPRAQVDVDAVLALVADPKNSGTKADYSKFHDDRSTWTGVALEGGPSTNDSRVTLQSQADRDNKADVRGVVH